MINNPHKSLIDRLARDLSVIIPRGSRVVFFDYAVFKNVGDLLISRSVEYFFKKNSNVVLDRFCMQNHSIALQRKFPEDAILVFQGGGNFGDLFRGHQEIRLRILSAHKERKSVILPQTIYYADANILVDDARTLSHIQDLTICARDSFSRDLARKHFDNRVELLPDTAHLLLDDFGVRPPGSETLKFIRVDQGAYSVTGLQILPRDPESFVDWPNFLTSREVAIIHRFQQMHSFDAKLVHSSIPYHLWRAFRFSLLRRSADVFLNSKNVITNRLHGLIFSLISRRPVEIVESGYGKVSAYYQTFLKDFDDVSIRNGEAHLNSGMSRVRDRS